MAKKIVLCDDHTLFLEGLCTLIEKNKAFTVERSFSNYLNCIDYISKNPPDIFICDLNLEKIDGFELVNQLKSFLTETLVIFLTAYNEHYLVEKARKQGVNAYLLKSTPAEEFFEVFERSITQPFYTNIEEAKTEKDFTPKDASFKQKFRLSKKEVEIIRLVVKGKTSQEIADVLFLSRFTVETHRRNIGKKLGISGITSLYQFAHENNLLD